jgi:hypothetical protein
VSPEAAQAGPRGGFFRTGPSVPPGTYRVVLTVDGKELAQNLRIEADPTLPVGVTVADPQPEEGEEEEEEIHEQGGRIIDDIDD